MRVDALGVRRDGSGKYHKVYWVLDLNSRSPHVRDEGEDEPE